MCLRSAQSKDRDRQAITLRVTVSVIRETSSSDMDSPHQVFDARLDVTDAHAPCVHGDDLIA